MPLPFAVSPNDFYNPGPSYENLFNIVWEFEVSLGELALLLFFNCCLLYLLNCCLVKTSNLNNFGVNFTLIEVISFVSMVIINHIVNNLSPGYYTRPGQVIFMWIVLGVISFAGASLIHWVYPSIARKHWMIWSFSLQLLSAVGTQFTVLIMKDMIRGISYIGIILSLLFIAAYATLITKQVQYHQNF